MIVFFHWLEHLNTHLHHALHVTAKCTRKVQNLKKKNLRFFNEKGQDSAQLNDIQNVVAVLPSKE